MYHALTRTDGWIDYHARLAQIIEGLKRDLERNPYDEKGRDRSAELRFGLYVARRILEVPDRFIAAEQIVTNALRQAAER